jgi:hypothetical protein
MPINLPRISGKLNNCALHACVPEIMDVIHELALQNYNEYTESYENLRASFVEFYGMDITWPMLDKLLTESVGNNKTAAQFMMGPVLRKFAGQDPNSDEMLDSKMLGEGLTKKLGFQLVAYTKTTDPKLPYAHEVHNIADPIATINIYNEGENHWERVPKSELNAVINDAQDLINSNTPVGRAFESGSL